MPKEPIIYQGVTFASEEERELYWWCEEALEHGLIEDFEYQSPTWQLAEPVIETIEQFGTKGQKIKPKSRVMLKGVTFTCDFHIRGTILDVPEYVDVKPAFTRRNDTARYFSLMRKWLYQRHGVLVHAVQPLELFRQTWAPAKARVTPKQGKPRAGYSQLRTVEEFLKDKP